MKEKFKEKREEILEMSPMKIKKLTKYKITFEDEGQDFLEWFIDKDGYVLDSKPFQRNIWAGKSTSPDFVQVGDLLPIFMEEREGQDCFSHINYPIKEIKEFVEQGDDGK